MAQNSLGTLSVDLVLKQGGFAQGLDKAERRLKGLDSASADMNSRFGRMSKGLAAVGAVAATAATGIGAIVVAATAGAAALAALEKQIFDIARAQSQLAKQAANMADALGTSTSAVQAFSYAAEQAGIEADKAVDILKDVADKLGDASLTGGGELGDALKDIGLSIKELQGLGPIAVLERLSKAIADLPRAQQVTVMEALADDASKLLPLLDDNAEALRKLMKEAFAVNNALTAFENQQLLEVNKAFKDIDATATNLKNTIAIAALPAVKDFAKEFAEFANDPEVREGLTTLVNLVGDLAGVLLDVVDAVARATAAVTNFLSGDSQIQNLTQEIKTVTGEIARLKSEMQGLPPGASAFFEQGLNDKLARRAKLMDQLRIASAKQSREAQAAGAAQSAAMASAFNGGSSGGSGGGYTAPAVGSGYTPPPIQTITVDSPDVSTVGERARAAMQQFDSSITTAAEIRDKYDQMAKYARIYYDGSAQQAKVLAQIQKREAEEIKRVTGDQFNTMSQFAKQAANNIQDALGETLERTLSGNFDGILKMWGDTLRDMAAQALAANLNEALFGKSFAKSGKLGGLLGIAATAIGGFFGGGMSTSTAQAGGLSPAAMSGNVFHSGGIVGGSGDVPIMAQAGEGVFTRAQMRSLAPVTAIGGDVQVTVVNNGEPLEVKKTEQRRGPSGEKIIEMHVEAALAEMVGDRRFDKFMRPYGVRRVGQF